MDGPRNWSVLFCFLGLHEGLYWEGEEKKYPIMDQLFMVKEICNWF